MTTPEASLADKNVLITGANTGIGRVTAEALATRGAKVWLACRSEEKATPVLEGIRTRGGKAAFLALDLADLASVRTAAKRFLDEGVPLHVLVNNAGLGGLRGTTKDGFEMHFGTNHLGHFLLTNLLLPRMRESAPARIVNVSSKSHYQAKSIPFDTLRAATKSAAGMPEYAVSKACNVLFTKELARGRAGEGVQSHALHPGVIASDIWRQVPWLFRPLVKMFMKTVEEGARCSIHCATAEGLEDGLYYDDCRPTPPSKLSEDATVAAELWRRSEAWTKA